MEPNMQGIINELLASNSRKEYELAAMQVLLKSANKKIIELQAEKEGGNVDGE